MINLYTLVNFKRVVKITKEAAMNKVTSLLGYKTYSYDKTMFNLTHNTYHIDVIGRDETATDLLIQITNKNISFMPTSITFLLRKKKNLLDNVNCNTLGTRVKPNSTKYFVCVSILVNTIHTHKHYTYKFIIHVKIRTTVNWKCSLISETPWPTSRGIYQSINVLILLLKNIIFHKHTLIQLQFNKYILILYS